jgi:hypothetical protein
MDSTTIAETVDTGATINTGAAAIGGVIVGPSPLGGSCTINFNMDYIECGSSTSCVGGPAYTVINDTTAKQVGINMSLNVAFDKNLSEIDAIGENLLPTYSAEPNTTLSNETTIPSYIYANSLSLKMVTTNATYTSGYTFQSDNLTASGGRHYLQVHLLPFTTSRKIQLITHTMSDVDVNLGTFHYFQDEGTGYVRSDGWTKIATIITFPDLTDHHKDRVRVINSGASEIHYSSRTSVEYLGTDISSKVMQVKTGSGRNYERDQFDAGEAEFILKNEDGIFTPRKTGTGAPYEGNITTNKSVRYLCIRSGYIYPVWAGFSSAWEVDLSSFGWSAAKLNCVDGFNRLSKKKVPSPYQTSVLNDIGPNDAYFTLQDSKSSTDAISIVGDGQYMELKSAKGGTGESDFGATGTLSYLNEKIFGQTSTDGNLTSLNMNPSAQTDQIDSLVAYADVVPSCVPLGISQGWACEFTVLPLGDTLTGAENWFEQRIKSGGTDALSGFKVVQNTDGTLTFSTANETLSTMGVSNTFRFNKAILPTDNYTFSTTITQEDPGAVGLRFNAAEYNSTSVVLIALQGYYFSSNESVWRALSVLENMDLTNTWSPYLLNIRDAGAPTTNFVNFQLRRVVFLDTYIKMEVDYYQSSGTLPTGLAGCWVSINRTQATFVGMSYGSGGTYGTIDLRAYTKDINSAGVVQVVAGDTDTVVLTASPFHASGVPNRACVGGVINELTGVSGGWFVGRLGHIAFFDSDIGGAQLDTHTVLWGHWSSITDATLIGTILAQAELYGYNRVAALDFSTATVGGAQWDSGSLLEVTQNASGYTNGTLFMGPDGVLMWRNFYSRASIVSSADFSGSNAALWQGFTPQIDDSNFVNMVTVNWPAGKEFIAKDRGSIGEIGEYTAPNIESATSDSRVTQDIAECVLSELSEDNTRVDQVTLDPSSYPALWDLALDLMIGDKITIGDLPALGPATELDMFVEKIEHVRSQNNRYLIQLQVSPVKGVHSVAQCDNTGDWGQLDTTDCKLGF